MGLENVETSPVQRISKVVVLSNTQGAFQTVSDQTRQIVFGQFMLYTSGAFQSVETCLKFINFVLLVSPSSIILGSFT